MLRPDTVNCWFSSRILKNTVSMIQAVPSMRTSDEFIIESFGANAGLRIKHAIRSHLQMFPRLSVTILSQVSHK